MVPIKMSHTPQIFGWPFIGPGLFSNRGASWARTGGAPGSVKAVILNFASLEHPYSFNFGMKNEEIGLNNTILWNNYPEILNG